MVKFKKIFTVLAILLFFSSCGYTPIFSKKDVNFSIAKIELLGDKDIGKKRSLIRLPINSDENFVIEKAKLESNVKKYLINNNIKKQIYVKNRLINFII